MGAVLLFALVLVGGLSKAEGIALIAALVVAAAGLVANAGQGPTGDELAVEVGRFFGTRQGRRHTREIGQTLVSLALMVVGANVLVHASSGLATRLGIGQGFVGLTLVAVGTSAPVIAIAIQAARRGDHDLVVGTVLGSNLFIALAGGVIVAFLRGGLAASVGATPMWLMAAVTVAAWGFMARGRVVTLIRCRPNREVALPRWSRTPGWWRAHRSARASGGRANARPARWPAVGDGP